jgi:hypothetical protein
MKYGNETPRVKLSTVATFPKNYFLENLELCDLNRRASRSSGCNLSFLQTAFQPSPSLSFP